MSNELYHHGVKGMKWGVRHDKQVELRNSYKRAQNEYRKAKRSRDWAFGRQKRESTGNAASKAALNLMRADVAYNVGKSKSAEKAKKAELKAYTRAIRRSGITGSVSDSVYGKQSSKVYNEIKTQKGKKYADMVESRAEKQLYAQIIGGSALALGSYAISLSLYDY